VADAVAGELPAARALFRDALTLDPTFATAHAAIASAIFWEWANGHVTDPDPARAELVASATRAVDCDARDSLAHSVMGLAYMETGRMSDSLAEHETAVTLNPNSAYGQWCSGYALNRADRYEEALARFDLAARLSPRDPAAWAFQTLRASALYLSGRYEEAIVAGRHGARLQTGDGVWPLVHWAAALGQLGRRDEAAPVVAEICRKRPGFSIAALKAWPHNRGRSAPSLEDMADGLRKAGVPE
jgi:tetratricopeptide (TPR) repeat protein